MWRWLCLAMHVSCYITQKEKKHLDDFRDLLSRRY